MPAHAPQGLCPGCLLKRGLDTYSYVGNSQTDRPSKIAEYAPPTPEELAGLFPDLEILELVGRGGMGVVYKARQKRLERIVALKILSPRLSQDPAFAERFVREAQAMAKLSHPHVVAVHDFGEVDGLYYFLMEFVNGVNLRQLLDAGKLMPEEALAIVPQICDALQYAHDHGVVHRDIKPENVLMDQEGQVKIADFGIAKLVGVEDSSRHVPHDATGGKPIDDLTAAGQVLGTPQYMAPEQVEHPLEVDHRADIYSLGVVFYQMLTGELPKDRFVPPSQKVQIDVRLDEVVLRAMEKEPQLRYQQASEVKTRVEDIASAPETKTNVKEVELEAARRQVKGPAVGLAVTGICTWLVFPMVLLALSLANRINGRPSSFSVAVCMLFSCLVILAALKMERLQAYGFATIGSILAIIISPSNLIGLPIGIWALVVLRRPEVRRAFKMKATEKKVTWSPPDSGWAWLIGKVGGITFTSRAAYHCANASALGFLGSLGFVPLPGWKGFSGFFGFFGLIGVAHIIEIFARPNLVVAKIISVLILIATVVAVVFISPSLYYQNANPPANIAVTDALEEYRKTLVAYDLGFDSVFPRREWKHYDAERLEMYPTKDAWPEVLGHVHTAPNSFKIIRANSPLTPVVSGPNAFIIPLKKSLVTEGYATLLFLKGITSEGTVVATSHTSLVCLGEMEGRLSFDTYATALIKGDMSGRITSQQYFNLVVTGKFTGRMLADCYAMIYLLGGFEGNLELNASKVYIAGRTPQADLSRITGNGEVYLEESDLPAGEHEIKNLKVTVGKTQSEAPQAPSFNSKKVDFVIGPHKFVDGDNIEIKEVYSKLGTLAKGDTVTVKGTYILASQPKAMLGISVTLNTGDISPVAMPVTTIESGSSSFELKYYISSNGHLHVSFYPTSGGNSFGSIYFGTKVQISETDDWDLAWTEKNNKKNLSSVNLDQQKNILATSTTGMTSLTEAVRIFNARAKTDPVGKDQPPLTEEEVIAAIRWALLNPEELSVSEETLQGLKHVINSRKLQQGFELEVLTDFMPNNQLEVTKWSVSLRIPAEPRGTTCISIREKPIRSRLLGEEEKKVAAVNISTKGMTSLSEALRVFNARAKNNPIGKSQPPLTKNEIIAAIRWALVNPDELPVSDKTLQTLREITNSHQLPPGFELEVLTDFVPDNQIEVTKWSVRLRIPAEPQGTTCISIREKPIRSRLLGEKEKKVMEKWQKKWASEGIVSSEVSEYKKELAKAAEADRDEKKSEEQEPSSEDQSSPSSDADEQVKSDKSTPTDDHTLTLRLEKNGKVFLNGKPYVGDGGAILHPIRDDAELQVIIEAGEGVSEDDLQGLRQMVEIAKKQRDPRNRELWEQIAQRKDPELRSEALEKLHAMLTNEKKQDRDKAVRALQKVGDIPFDRTKLLPLVRALIADKEQSASARAIAAVQLANLGGDKEDIPMIAAMVDEPNSFIRKGVARALYNLDPSAEHPQTAPTIEKLLNDASNDVVQQTIRSLWSHPVSPAAERRLIELSKGPGLYNSSGIAYDAVYYALSTRPKVSLPVTERLAELALSPGIHSVSQRATWGLSHHLADDDAKEVVVKTLIQIVDDSLDASLRRDCIWGLGSHGGETAVEKLKAIVAEEKNEMLRKEAESALRRAEAITALQNTKTD